jgi:hypothetical protein
MMHPTQSPQHKVSSLWRLFVVFALHLTYTLKYTTPIPTEGHLMQCSVYKLYIVCRTALCILTLHILRVVESNEAPRLPQIAVCD